MLAPALRIVPVGDDADLRACTNGLLNSRPTSSSSTTGIGLRGWLEAAEGWGPAEPLRAALARGYLIARGPKARGAIRAAGLTEVWSPASEILRRGARPPARPRGSRRPGRGAAARRPTSPSLTRALQEAGAEVVEVPVYRWAPPVDPAPLRRLVELILARQVDAVAFTSAPAVEALLHAAGTRREALLAALRH